MNKATVVKEGNVLQSYTGEYFKVVTIRGGAAFLSPFFKKEKAAKKAERGMLRMNAYGLSRVIGAEKGSITLKDGGAKKVKKTEDDSNDETDEETTEPTLEDKGNSELKEILKEAGLSVSGNKEVLIARIREETNYEDDEEVTEESNDSEDTTEE